MKNMCGIGNLGNLWGGSLIWIDISNISKSKKLSILLILAQIWSFLDEKNQEKRQILVF